MGGFLVTCARNERPALRIQAQEFARQFALPFIERQRRSMAELENQYGTGRLIVMTGDGPRLVCNGQTLFFHLNLAGLRIAGLQRGGDDKMVSALRLEPGMTVCDCTLGLAADAAVMAFAVGPGGRVVGIEKSFAIYMFAAWGCRNFSAAAPEVVAALRRIEVMAGDLRHFLVSSPDNSFDAVYFDPMYQKPVVASAGLAGLRPFAEHRPLSVADLDHGVRVAVRRVVVKFRSQEDLPPWKYSRVIGSRYSNVNFAVIEK
ncbi:MAG: class I SAM-dependent methyltransferase [Negativicutes bacterium]|nr:class I SAM-dependent methyltransferase [Negativicutes bacterium]